MRSRNRFVQEGKSSCNLGTRTRMRSHSRNLWDPYLGAQIEKEPSNGQLKKKCDSGRRYSPLKPRSMRGSLRVMEEFASGLSGSVSEWVKMFVVEIREAYVLRGG